MKLLPALVCAMAEGMGVRFEAYSQAGPNGESLYGIVVYPTWAPQGQITSFQSTFSDVHDDEVVAQAIINSVSTIDKLMNEKGMPRPIPSADDEPPGEPRAHDFDNMEKF